MQNVFKLTGKHIILTGASSGIGRQIAISLSQAGAILSIVGRNESRLRETLALMEGNHQYYTADITHQDKIQSIVENAVIEQGKIDGFVHSAGIEKLLPMKLHTPDVFNDLISINTLAAFEFSRQILLKKNSNPQAALLFIASITASFGQAGQVGYCASKGALVAGAKALAVEYAKRQIRVNCISPGQVKDTPMTREMESSFTPQSLSENINNHPLGWVDTEDIANAAVFLLSSASKKITGINLFVDGGYSAT